MTELIDIKESRYAELKKNPLIFLRLYEKYYYDEHGNETDQSQWQSIDRDLSIRFPAGNFANRELGYCLTIIGEAEEKKDKEGNVVQGKLLVPISNVTGSNPEEWEVIIDCFITKHQDKYNNNYAFLELLWALDKLSWNKNTLKNIINSYPKGTSSFIISNLSNLGRCLSIEKQQMLKEVCESLDGRYNIFIPQTISNLYKDKSYNLTNNLFQLIDRIFERPYNSKVIEKFDENNQLIAIYKWLHTEGPLVDYTILTKPIYSIVSEENRLNIVKRYFHDIKNEYTRFNLEIMENLKNSNYDDFIRYRYCLETPAEPIILTVPLLCDSLITLYNSNGKSFQSFEGVLDLAMVNCDSNNPGVDFKLNRILPICANGAVSNDRFKGFIDYSIVTCINEELLHEDNLQKELRNFLDHYGTRKKYYACRYLDKSPIAEEILPRCQDIINRLKEDCRVSIPYNNKWIVTGKIISFLNKFLFSPIENIRNELDYDIDLEMISISNFKHYILSLPDKFQICSGREFVVPSYKKSAQEFDFYLVECFGEKLRMRFNPQRYALVGLRFDVFGIKEKIFSELPESVRNNSKCEEYIKAYRKCQAEEASEVHKRTVASLQKEFGVEISSKGYFEVPFDRALFYKIVRKYYFKETIKEDDRLSEIEFLIPHAQQEFMPFCAPKLADAKNPAIDLPFFWCRGSECFHNNLATQVVSEDTYWKSYTLYHMVEILGYPMLKETEAGYEPYEAVRQYIAVSNKVMQKFRRLKCRACGHLLFSGKSFGFNRYNYYGCVNPGCAEYNKPIYLNYCFHCKNGLIDSRDSKQCTNGWYICPKCLSCCDDNQYERLAQRYQLNGQTPPDRIQNKIGQGHNDKGIYFCPQCGKQIETIENGNGSHMKACPNCHIPYDSAISAHQSLLKI